VKFETNQPENVGCAAESRHMITAWGDEQGAGDLTSNPDEVIITDSDRWIPPADTVGNPDEQTYEYVWDGSLRAWHIDYNLLGTVTGNPFLFNVVTLSPPDEECDGQGQTATGSYRIQNERDDPAVGLQYIVGTDIRICTYETTLDHYVGEGETQEYPQIVKYHEEEPYDYEYLEVVWELADYPVPPGSWVTINTDFLLPLYNDVYYQDVRFTYTESPTTGDPKPAIEWQIDTADVLVPRTGGYVIGAFEMYDDEVGTNLVGEYRLQHEYGMICQALEEHEFSLETYDEANSYWIGDLRFGRSPERLDAQVLWEFDEWLESAVTSEQLAYGSPIVQSLSWEGEVDYLAAPAPDSMTPDQGNGTKNRYLSFWLAPAMEQPAIRVKFVEMPGYEYAEGRTMWVQEPFEVTEVSGSDGSAPAPVFWAARLGCEPYFTEWSVYTAVHVFDAAIVPDAQFDVRAIRYASAPGETDLCSPKMEVGMSAVGDLVGDCGFAQCTSPQGVVDFVDISAVVDKFRNLPGAPGKVRADLINSTVSHPEPDRKIDFVDISYCVDAFRGAAAPLPGPPEVDPCSR